MCLLHRCFRAAWKTGNRGEKIPGPSPAPACPIAVSLQSSRAAAKTRPKPPAALPEARTYLPVFTETALRLKHVHPARRKSVQRRDSQSRQRPDTLAPMRSEFQVVQRGSVIKHSTRKSDLPEPSPKQRPSLFAATKLPRDYKKI